MIQAGGIGGGLLLSWCIDRGKTVAAMVSAYGITAIMLGLFLLVPFRSGACWLLLLVIGGGTSGAQFGLIVLSATIYPAVIRATGIGWGASVARGGAILSPLIGGWIMQQQIAPFKVLGMLAVPVALCGASFLLFPSVLCHTED
jgi:AAHS family 4-hydroxybenzoate transporter-like MFS transporter